MDLIDLSAVELSELYRRRVVSPVEVIDRLLDRIDSLDSEVGAFRTVLADSVREEARQAQEALDRGEPVGSLHGVPVAVKELFDVAGAEGCYGSLVFAGRISPTDAEVVSRLRRAGALIIGTTRSHEFAWGITNQHADLGSTANPWDLSRVPGGSSGGSAAALAARMCPIALGTDTGGSIRIPAAFCGVAGIKPTFGRVPQRGAVALAPSLDHPGPLARTVPDLRLALDAIAGPDPDDPSTIFDPMQPALPGKKRIAVCPDLHLTPLEEDYQRAFDEVVKRLEEAGNVVVEVDFAGASAIRPAFADIQMAEAYHYHTTVLRTFPDQADRYGADVGRRLQRAGEITVSQYLTARQVQARTQLEFRRLFDQADLLLTPVSAGGPSSRQDPNSARHLGRDLPFRDLVMDYTVPQDLAGIPAAAFPVGLDRDGLPIGFQFSAPWGREYDALAAAASVWTWLGDLPIDSTTDS